MRLKNIKKLVEVLEKSNVSEIELTDFWGRKIRISKSSNNTVTQAAASKTQIVAQKPKVEEKKREINSTNTVAIKSPIVGTFYRAPAPDAPPYVEVGDMIKPGQVVCIVEAMKLMNEIESDVAGKIVKIVLKNEDPVEYNQDLFLVEPI